MAGLDILCLGEPLVEFNDQGGGLWREGLGGDVSNVAIAAARQGARSGIATRLGRDAFGDAFVAAWEREGVDTGAAGRDPEAPTGLYFVRHDADGHHFEYRRSGSAASRMAPETLPEQAIREAGILHLSGITQAISESAEAAGTAAIGIAKAAGARVSYDPNLRLRLWPLERARAVIHGAMRQADIALPGLEDARTLTGLAEPEEIVAFYRALGPGIVALTLGADGALIAAGERAVRLPAPPVRAVDATGAGDCFDGAFLARLAATDDPFEAGRYAVAAAALSVEGYGAVAPIPTAERVGALLERATAGPPDAAS